MEDQKDFEYAREHADFLRAVDDAVRMAETHGWASHEYRQADARVSALSQRVPDTFARKWK